MPSRSGLYLSPNPSESLHEQILKVPAHTVRSQGPQIVDVKLPVDVSVPDLLRIDTVEPVVADDLLGDVHIQTLEGIGHVAVLPNPPVHLVQIVIDDGDISKELCDLADVFMLFPVQDVGFGYFGMSILDEDLFDNVLDMLDGRNTSVFVLAANPFDYLVGELLRLPDIPAAYGLDRGPDRSGDLLPVKGNDLSVSLSNDLHFA